MGKFREVINITSEISGARKILKKKFTLPEEDRHFNFVQYIAAFISTVTKYYSCYVVGLFLRKIGKCSL
jgi:hypothetical protein